MIGPHRTLPAALVLAGALAAAPAPSEPPPPAAYPTPEETRAELQAVCNRLTQGNNPFFGRAVLADLERQLASGDADLLSTILLRQRLAHELIRVGRHEEAIGHLEKGLAEIDAHDELTDRGNLRYRHLLYLAIAHLQVAEDQNCIERHTAASCILPIAPEAVHRVPEHTRTAGDILRVILEANPHDVQSRWLLNLTRMISGDYPDGVPERFRLPEGVLPADGGLSGRWTDVAAAVGIEAFDLSGGGILDDFDGDGLIDVISSSWDPCEPAKAFRNDGEGGFENVSDEWGLSSQLGGLNMVHADFDGDGMLDLLILRGAWLGEDGQIRNSLLRNDLQREAGRFVDVTAAAGLAYPAYPTQGAAWADYDEDGDLDLFIGNEATAQNTDPIALYGKTGNAYPSQLFRNNGDGTFTDVARTAGVTNRRFAKGATWGDYDEDGDLDLYVSNIGANRLYRNRGDGTFEDVAPKLGVEEPAAGSFPTWFFDYDNDGDLDLFVAPYNAKVHVISASYLGRKEPTGHPFLYENDGDGTFTDISLEAGLDRPLLVMGANYGDLDNDGYPDLYLGTGVPDFDALMPNVMYRNRQGEGFEDVTFTRGFGHLQKGHAVAFGDVDNDGEQEIFQQLGGAFPFDGFGNALYENPGTDNAWIGLRLEGKKANRFGLGARIAVRARDGERVYTIHSVAGPGGSFGGGTLQQEIGLGSAEAIESVTIRWPGGGAVQELPGVAPGRYYRAIEGEPELVPLELPVIQLGSGDSRDAHTTHRHRGS